MPSAVSLTDAGKRYVKYDDVPLLITRAWRFSTGQRRSQLWALRHVDMEIQPGESVGVIGRNGAGGGSRGLAQGMAERNSQREGGSSSAIQGLLRRNSSSQ